MKINFSLLAIAVAFAFASASGTANANPLAAKPSSNVPAQYNQSNDPAQVPATMNNYWDAREWDSEGAATFWHATESAQPQVVTNPNTRARKGSRLVKKLFKR